MGLSLVFWGVEIGGKRKGKCWGVFVLERGLAMESFFEDVGLILHGTSHGLKLRLN